MTTQTVRTPEQVREDRNRRRREKRMRETRQQQAATSGDAMVVTYAA